MKLAEVENGASIEKSELSNNSKGQQFIEGLNGTMRGATGELEMFLVSRLVPSGLKNEQMKKKKMRGKTRTKAMNPLLHH